MQRIFDHPRRIRTTVVNHGEDILGTLSGIFVGVLLLVFYTVRFIIKVAFFVSIMLFLILSGFYMYSRLRVQAAQVRLETAQADFAVASYNASLSHGEPYVARVMEAENKIKLAEKDIINLSVYGPLGDSNAPAPNQADLDRQKRNLTDSTMPGMRINKVLLVLILLSFSAEVASAPASGFCFSAAGAEYGITPEILWSIAKVESGFNPQAVRWDRNGTYDYGVMQINSGWAPRPGLAVWRSLGDPCTNVWCGAWILARRIRRYGYTWETVGCYNASNNGKRARYARKIYVVFKRNYRH